MHSTNKYFFEKEVFEYGKNLFLEKKMFSWSDESGSEE